MHAQEANRLAIEANLAKIIQQIEDNAKNGYFRLCLDRFDSQVQEELRKLGYQVENGGSGVVTYIYWTHG